MKRTILLSMAVAAFIIAALLFITPHRSTRAVGFTNPIPISSSNTTLLSIQPASQTVAVGSTFDVTVVISGLAAPMSAFQFNLSYDQTRLRWISTAPGSFLASTGRSPACPPPARLSLDTLSLACVLAGGSPGPVGSGTVLKITFSAIQVGSSPLSLSALQVAGAGLPPASIPAAAANGTVNVIEAYYHLHLPVITKKP